MRKFLFLLILSSFTACNDGDFEIPSFDFNSSVNTCGTYVVYRTNDSRNEALILHLSDQEILQEETTTPIELRINADNVQYRIFNSEVNTNYFCADIPPTEPIVTRNWSGVEGSNNYISIETTVVTDTNNLITGYKHTITLYNLVLESNDENITFESYFFGSFITNI
jgi:hypothetical protein